MDEVEVETRLADMRFDTLLPVSLTEYLQEHRTNISDKVERKIRITKLPQLVARVSGARDAAES